MDQIDQLNECARILYKSQGYDVEKGYDFQAAIHPQEQMCFIMAVRSHNFWMEQFKTEEKL